MEKWVRRSAAMLPEMEGFDTLGGIRLALF
jgi:hypothetical protein